MPGRLFVASIGFHENFIIRLLAQKNARRGDRLVLVTVDPPAKAVKTAVSTIEALAGRLGLTIEDLIALDPERFHEDTAGLLGRLSRIACEMEAEEIVFEGTSGSRALLLALLLTALAMARSWRTEFIVQSDTGGDWIVRLPWSLLRLLASPQQVTGEDERILEAVIETPGIHQDDLSTMLGIHPKTLANRLSKLTKLGLVARKGRPRSLVPGEWTIYLILARLQARKRVCESVNKDRE